jgi:oligopeptidase B
VFPFSDHVVVYGRRDGNPCFTVLPEEGDRYEIEFAEEAYRLRFGENLEYDTTTLRITFESLLSPPQVIDVDLVTRAQTLVKEREIPGDYQRDRYRQYRIWAETNGVRIPISVCHRRDLDLPAPLLLYGYGAYESVLDPSFDAALISLLDRGVVYAIAHVRGGGEMGRLWHHDGRMAHKSNTFDDFIASAEHLLETGIALPGKLAARGLSAGGLLMGAITVSRPELWRAIVAEVPFVDAINSMLDPTLPLTIGEWEEWGNPAEEEHYRWMRSYSPYENTIPANYPALLATAGLHDQRVKFWEPAKWVAKLREVNTGEHPMLLKTDLGAGHAGPSGRYDAWRDEAFILAFVLDSIAGE